MTRVQISGAKFFSGAPWQVQIYVGMAGKLYANTIYRNRLNWGRMGGYLQAYLPRIGLWGLHRQHPPRRPWAGEGDTSCFPCL